MFEQYESIMDVEEVCEALRIGKSRLYMLLYENKLRDTKKEGIGKYRKRK